MKRALLLALLALGACDDGQPARPNIATDIGLPAVITLPQTTTYVVLRADLGMMQRKHDSNAFTICNDIQVGLVWVKGCAITLPEVGQATPDEMAVLFRHELGHVAGCNHGTAQTYKDGTRFVVWKCPK